MFQPLRGRSRLPELLADMHGALSVAFQKDGKSPNDAEHDAGVAIEAFVESFGGETVYLPTAALAKVEERNERIRQEFTGNNHRELARKFGNSIQHIYRIVKKEEATS
jgi:Mor family transcriptional regulator